MESYSFQNENKKQTQANFYIKFKIIYQNLYEIFLAENFINFWSYSLFCIGNFWYSFKNQANT